MAKLMSTIIDGFISSKKFVSGLWGEGWRIGKRNNRYTLEVDDIVVRNTMTVFELLISKIRAVKGALGITQASGKVKAVTSDEYHFFVEIEEVNSFCVDDIIRCMEVKEVKREYWVIVSGVEGNRLTIARSEFRDVEPLPGDELVQFGNVSDKRRQSAIYLHADENGEPAIDVLQGIKEKSLEGCMRVRVGGLDGIVDADFREGIQDFGIYCTNGYFKGTIAGGGGYLLRSDGTGYICNGAIWWDKEKKVHFDGEVVLGWENLPPDAREQLKGDQGEQGEPGEKGEDANLLSWVKEWDEGKTQIGSEYLISPKIFSGQNTGTADEPVLTGVAIGKNVCEINGVKKSGVWGLKDGKVTFSIDAETGDAMYRGELNVNDNTIIDTEGNLTTKNVNILGGEFMGFDLQDKWLIAEHDNFTMRISAGYPDSSGITGTFTKPFIAFSAPTKKNHSSGYLYLNDPLQQGWMIKLDGNMQQYGGSINAEVINIQKKLTVNKKLLTDENLYTLEVNGPIEVGDKLNLSKIHGEVCMPDIKPQPAGEILKRTKHVVIDPVTGQLYYSG